MAGVPAYRYDHEVARPYSPSAPSVRVVPGRKHAVNPALSDFAVTGIKVVIACLVVFLIIGFVFLIKGADFFVREVPALQRN